MINIEVQYFIRAQQYWNPFSTHFISKIHRHNEAEAAIVKVAIRPEFLILKNWLHGSFTLTHVEVMRNKNHTFSSCQHLVVQLLHKRFGFGRGSSFSIRARGMALFGTRNQSCEIVWLLLYYQNKFFLRTKAGAPPLSGSSLENGKRNSFPFSVRHFSACFATWKWPS